MALLQSIEDKQFAANVKMLRQSIDKIAEERSGISTDIFRVYVKIEELCEEQKRTNELLVSLLDKLNSK